MANPEHLAILKQGVDAWNAWREEHPEIVPDLSTADLSRANLRKARFNDATLDEVQFVQAHLDAADLTGANLEMALFHEASLLMANLQGASLTSATLMGANLRKANLSEADLTRAGLYEVNFTDTDLTGATGLETCHHYGPSTLDRRTLTRNPHLPDRFLRGCGLSDWEIESAKLYRLDLTPAEIADIQDRMFELRAGRPIQIHNLFISYTHADGAFVDQMEGELDRRGIRFWRDIHDAPAGRLEKIVVRAMRENPTVLLILSERSTESDWVEFEVRKARELEKELKRDVLCPVALDDSWKTCGWPERLRQQITEYNTLDFSEWNDAARFSTIFERLVVGLKLFYKPGDET